MAPELRRARILQVLADRPMTTVCDLACRLDVSESTIYRDLRRLRGERVKAK